MNPKDMTNEALLDAWLKEMKGDYEHGCPCESEVQRRLNERDVLRKENEELKAQNLLIRGDNADLLANADAYSFNISNMHTKMLQLLEENVELRKDKGQLEIRDF